MTENLGTSGAHRRDDHTPEARGWADWIRMDAGRREVYTTISIMQKFAATINFSISVGSNVPRTLAG